MDAVPGAPPSGSERVLYGALLILAVIGLLSPGRFNAAPAETLLEVAFLAAVALMVRRVAPGGWPVLVIGGLYLGLKAILFFLYSPASVSDFAQAYKTFYYLVALGFLVGKGRFDGRRLARVTILLAAAFLVKYGYSIALGLDPRPGIYLENNFELIMLLGLVYLAWPYLDAWKRNPLFLVVTVTVLLSGSRSAALSLLCVYIALYVRVRNRTWPLHLAGVAAVGYAVYSIFSSRAAEDGSAQLDRLNFLHTFLYEVRDWPLWEWFTGSFPLTPLSPGSCGSLSFYSLLFSQSDPGVCYSVILHSFFLRAAFDHGVIGLVVLYGLLWWGMRRAGTSRRDTFVLLTMISVSGLSVSAFNNVFVAIVLAVAVGLNRRQARHEGSEGTGPAAETLRPPRRPLRRGPFRSPARPGPGPGRLVSRSPRPVPGPPTPGLERGGTSRTGTLSRAAPAGRPNPSEN